MPERGRKHRAAWTHSTLEPAQIVTRTAAEELTPAQRRTLDARLAEGLAAREDAWARDAVARLQADPHPHVRAAALTPARAADLITEPARETSWHVLARADTAFRV